MLYYGLFWTWSPCLDLRWRSCSTGTIPELLITSIVRHENKNRWVGDPLWRSCSLFCVVIFHLSFGLVKYHYKKQFTWSPQGIPPSPVLVILSMFLPQFADINICTIVCYNEFSLIFLKSVSIYLLWRKCSYLPPGDAAVPLVYIWWQPKCNTVSYGLNSFRYKGPKIWNFLPNYTKEAISLSEFKFLIKSWDRPTCFCNLCQTMLETNVDYG